MRHLILLFVIVSASSSHSQYKLDWTKQKIYITIPNTPDELEEDTINDLDYFEYVDYNYDFGIEVIFKGDEGFEYHKDIYNYALKELESQEDYKEGILTLGKIPGINSFYAVYEDEEIDQKTGAKYKIIVGELLFYSSNKKKLYMMDIEFDNTTISVVENIFKSIKFYS